MGYVLIVIIAANYLLLQKIKFDNMQVEVYRSEDQCCYDVLLGRRSYTFDNGNLRSKRGRGRKVICTFNDVDTLEGINWKDKWKIWRSY